MVSSIYYAVVVVKHVDLAKHRQPGPDNPNERLEIGDVGFIHQENGHFVRLLRARSDHILHPKIPFSDPLYQTYKDLLKSFEDAQNDANADVRHNYPCGKDTFLPTQSVRKVEVNASAR